MCWRLDTSLTKIGWGQLYFSVRRDERRWSRSAFLRNDCRTVGKGVIFKTAEHVCFFSWHKKPVHKTYISGEDITNEKKCSNTNTSSLETLTHGSQRQMKSWQERLCLCYLAGYKSGFTPAALFAVCTCLNIHAQISLPTFSCVCSAEELSNNWEETMRQRAVPLSRSFSHYVSLSWASRRIKMLGETYEERKDLTRAV